MAIGPFLTPPLLAESRVDTIVVDASWESVRRILGHSRDDERIRSCEDNVVPAILGSITGQVAHVVG